MVSSNKIHLKKHIHKNQEHIHIYFGSQHNHNDNKTDVASILTIGALMGIGGVRGMLITLGAIQGEHIDISMIFAFTSGVMVIFIGFGSVILYINQNLLNNEKNIKRIFATAGIVSLVVGTNMILS
jgi:hypothetical protein